MGGETFKRRLVHSYSVTVAIAILYCCYNYIVNVLNCKAHLKQNLNTYALLCVPQ